jgi:ElaB/YqjD/DUF883 family membrane-anchored ribosome-binding protein
MIETPRRTGFPADMVRAAHESPTATGTVEAMARDALDRLQDYVREQPMSAMLCALGIGFVLGWRLKP